MTGDPNKGVPLPSGPASLCFDKDVFMKDNFDVDQFVMECKRRVQLENLRDDLNVYLKILRSAMIELINKDYADFVNLSTNLVGMDKAIGSLTVPLGQLREEVLSVKTAMDSAIAAVEEKLRHREHVRQKKATLQRLMNIVESVEKIERLLGIHGGNTSPGQLNGQLIERVANEFNKLQFYVTKSKGLPLVENIKPRIANITTTLQYSLEGQFLDGLQKGDVQVLQQCLRTYALIDKIRDVENLFRQNIVKPFMEEMISEDSLKSNPAGLQGMYDKILSFIPSHCKLLQEVTHGQASSTSEIVRGFDFLVNAVWPEIVSNIEARMASIFAPGNPEAFHKKFKISMKFVEDFEKQCGSQASVKRLRDHASYHTFMTKWSLPVYYQIRFQDIAGEFETALDTPFNNASDSSTFRLNSTSALWSSLQRCWSEDIYLDALCGKFWKLNLEILSRYSHWLDECYQEEIKGRMEKETKKPDKVELNGIDKQGGEGDAANPTSRETPAAPPVTTGQILCLIADADMLCLQIFDLFEITIKPRIIAIGFDRIDDLKDNLQQGIDAIKSQLPKYEAYVVEELTVQCSIHLKQASDIPRLYRRTNKDVPSKPSTYVANTFKPIQLFRDEHSEVLKKSLLVTILQQVFSSVAEQYSVVTSDVLTSVKKMEESLKRLKKVRGTDKSSGNQGPTDDDKIRHQFILDIEHYGKQVRNWVRDRKITVVVALDRLSLYTGLFDRKIAGEE
ncbi:hypothetical protein FSP39_019157 [Pinctada imbricata]|uniref:Conserved oligomeric Golgi complex subunit 2 n=1 Tax=Pinctada imbricata TaxID=66713 RepID=A0AA89BSB0_PINIB|nr:hypothetical protein FSP39_019157 [Pinctada imbricata]